MIMPTAPVGDSVPRQEQALTVEGRDVVLILSLLAPDDQERVAATIASIAVAAATDPEMNKRAWRTFVDDVLSRHVAFSIDGEPDLHRVDWWDAVLRHAATAFVKANRLEPAIRRHVGLFASMRAVSLDWLPS
jgi:hypothetical protein